MQLVLRPYLRKVDAQPQWYQHQASSNNVEREKGNTALREWRHNCTHHKQYKIVHVFVSSLSARSRTDPYLVYKLHRTVDIDTHIQNGNSRVTYPDTKIPNPWHFMLCYPSPKRINKHRWNSQASLDMVSNSSNIVVTWNVSKVCK